MHNFTNVGKDARGQLAHGFITVKRDAIGAWAGIPGKLQRLDDIFSSSGPLAKMIREGLSPIAQVRKWVPMILVVLHTAAMRPLTGPKVG